MTRRDLFRESAAVAGTGLLQACSPFRLLAQTLSGSVPIPLEIAFDQPGPTLPANFTGLGYEISSIARKGLIDPHNTVYVEMVRALGRNGVIRVGGNTSDFSRYAPAGPAVSSPKSTAITAADLHDLGGFLQATGWQLIWGLNLGSDRTPENLANALDEAEMVARFTGPHLLAVEIGNEPDLFGVEHRPKPYSYDLFRREFEVVRDALLKRLPNLPLAGPDVAAETAWVARFAADEKQNLCLLTRHYYRGSQSSPTSSARQLLSTDPTLAPMLAEMRAASRTSGLPFRLCEVNSFSGGGKPGVSDTFTEALWLLDFMLRTAGAGAAGVNIETGVNQLGFISSYSPIADDEHDRYTAAPGFYGMLAFAQIGLESGTARLLPVTLGPTPLNLTAYAVGSASGETTLIVINREMLAPAALRVPQPSGAHASLLRLDAPSPSATRGVTLGGVPVSLSGSWHAPQWKPIPAESAAFTLTIPACSAALIKLTCK